MYNALHSQINTRTGGAINVQPNVPNTNTNVGIGTNNPQEKLDVRGNIQGNIGIFTNSLPNGTNFTTWEEAKDRSLVLSAGSLLGSGPGYLRTRMLHLFDFPQSNFSNKPSFYFGIYDRKDKTRFNVIGETDGITQMGVFNKNGEEIMMFNEDGNDNMFFQFGKLNSRVIIGGYANDINSLGHKFFVKGGSAKIEGNIFTDANIGIGASNFVDGSDIYRLSVNGAIRAHRVKVYTTWADYVFEKDYKLPSLEDVEKHIDEKGHLLDIPSAKEVEEKGIELGEMNKLLLQKIEELTLYVIQLNKEIKNLKGK